MIEPIDKHLEALIRDAEETGERGIIADYLEERGDERGAWIRSINIRRSRRRPSRLFVTCNDQGRRFSKFGPYHFPKDAERRANDLVKFWLTQTLWFTSSRARAIFQWTISVSSLVDENNLKGLRIFSGQGHAGVLLWNEDLAKVSVIFMSADRDVEVDVLQGMNGEKFIPNPIRLQAGASFTWSRTGGGQGGNEKLLIRHGNFLPF